MKTGVSRALMVAACLIGMSLGGLTQAQSSKRAVGGLGSAISDWADRQAALDAEIELAKAKAAIEVDSQRRLQALRTEEASNRSLDEQVQKVAQSHPQWKKIVTSSIYKSWLRTRPIDYQDVCMRTVLANPMISCIDDFFNAKIAQVQ